MAPTFVTNDNNQFKVKPGGQNGLLTNDAFNAPQLGAFKQFYD